MASFERNNCFGEAQFPLVDDYSTGRLAAKMKGDECVIHVGLAIVFEVKDPRCLTMLLGRNVTMNALGLKQNVQVAWYTVKKMHHPGRDCSID